SVFFPRQPLRQRCDCLMRRTLRAVSRGEPLHPPETQTGFRTSCSNKTGEEAVPQRISLHSTPRRSPPPETGPLYLTFMLSLSGRGKEKVPGSLGYARDDTKNGRRKERLSIRANLTPSPFPCGKVIVFLLTPTWGWGYFRNALSG